MPNASNQTALKAGVFVIVSIVLAVLVVVLLANVQSKLYPTTDYTVRFSLADGAAGLAPDSPVRVGGRDVGRVTDISFERSGDEITGVLVEIAVKDSLVFHEGAVAFLERPLLGSGAVLNFESTGPAASAPVLAEDGMITGLPQVPQFLAQAGFGAQQRTQLQGVLDRAEEASHELRDGINTFNGMMAEAQSRSEVWFDRVDATSAAVQSGADQANDLISTIQNRVDANAPKVDTIIENAELASASIRDASQHVNDITMDQIDELIASAKNGADQARSAIEHVESLIVEESPSLRKALANARLASDQLRLSMGEIRRAPWRLLYRPSERELEFELLYDAARAYADAASDLRSAGESLDAVASRDAADESDVLTQTERLTETFESFRVAEERFLDLLTDNTP